MAHDVKNGKTKPIYGMGRHNHENSVAVPGFDELVVLSGDDTFQTNPPASSQLYMYTAADSDELWADEGTLHAFVADGTDNDYFDLQPGETISGNFVAVPEEIAKGKDADDGHELTQAVDFPSYPAPTGGPSVPPDGPQWILDQWGNVAEHAERRGQRRLRLHPARGRRVRQAAGDVERRLHRRLGPGNRRSSQPADDVDKRAHLQDGARSR